MVVHFGAVFLDRIQAENKMLKVSGDTVQLGKPRSQPSYGYVQFDPKFGAKVGC